MPEERLDAIEDDEVETAAAVIEDLLYLLSPDKRAATLASAAHSENSARADREKHGPFRVMSAADLHWSADEERLWQNIMQFKARLVYVFIRNITNNHSGKRAAELLFEEHVDVPGSGLLSDYLDDLPRAAE